MWVSRPGSRQQLAVSPGVQLSGEAALSHPRPQRSHLQAGEERRQHVSQYQTQTHVNPGHSYRLV